MNNIDVKIRLATKDDIESIIRIMRLGFPKKILEMIIYGCHGIEKYLETQIEIPISLRDSEYYIAEVRGYIAGFVELRRFKEIIFLNQISVHPDFRNYGLGTKLLKESVSQLKDENFKTLMLDVFSDNSVAINWYENLGFQVDYISNWWDIPTNIFNNKGEYKLNGYPQAIAAQRIFGFSQFSISTTKGEHIIGVLGSKWYRVTNSEVLCNMEVYKVLYNMDPSRKILAILNNKELPASLEDSSQLILSSKRMSMRIEKLINNLKLKF